MVEATDVKGELGKSEIEKRADELSEGFIGKPTDNEGVSESPIEEAKRLSKSLKEDMAELKKMRREIEDTLSVAALSGKSFGNEKPKEMSQEEADTIRANQIAKGFTG